MSSEGAPAGISLYRSSTNLLGLGLEIGLGIGLGFGLGFGLGLGPRDEVGHLARVRVEGGDGGRVKDLAAGDGHARLQHERDGEVITTGDPKPNPNHNPNPNPNPNPSPSPNPNLQHEGDGGGRGGERGEEAHRRRGGGRHRLGQG